MTNVKSHMLKETLSCFLLRGFIHRVAEGYLRWRKWNYYIVYDFNDLSVKCDCSCQSQNGCFCHYSPYIIPLPELMSKLKQQNCNYISFWHCQFVENIKYLWKINGLKIGRPSLSLVGKQKCKMFFTMR